MQATDKKEEEALLLLLDTRMFGIIGWPETDMLEQKSRARYLVIKHMRSHFYKSECICFPG